MSYSTFVCTAASANPSVIDLPDGQEIDIVISEGLTVANGDEVVVVYDVVEQDEGVIVGVKP